MIQMQFSSLSPLMYLNDTISRPMHVILMSIRALMACHILITSKQEKSLALTIMQITSTGTLIPLQPGLGIRFSHRRVLLSFERIKISSKIGLRNKLNLKLLLRFHLQSIWFRPKFCGHSKSVFVITTHLSRTSNGSISKSQQDCLTNHEGSSEKLYKALQHYITCA